MTEIPVSIIEAGLEHLDMLVPLFDAYRQFYQQPSDLENARHYLTARLEAEEAIIFIAVRGSADGVTGVGFSLLYPMFSSVSMRRVWILNDLYVAPEGRRGGVATDLIEYARQYAIETEARGLELATAPDNAAAQALYESLGWERDTFYHYYLNV